jgi:fatty-acyl-CoA synthase
MNADNAIEGRRQRLRDRYPTWTSRTLADWLDTCAQQFAERPFVLTDTLSLTYRDVAAQSHRIAAGLRRLGVGRGDRVGIVMANYPQFVTVKFAIARLGAIAVPFNYLYQRNELRYVIADSGCRVLITMTAFGKSDYQQMLDEIAPGWESDGFSTRAAGGEDITQLRHVVVLPTAAAPRAGALTFEWLAEPGPGDACEAPSIPTPRPEDPADMLYTSGTTGFPKGVLTSHDSVLRTAYASALTRAYEDGRRILFSLPCYHMFGYIEGLLSVMFVGGAVILLPQFSAEAYFAGVARHRATDMLCVPTMAVAMVESPLRNNYDLSSLQALLCGSAPAPIWLWQKVESDFGVTEIVTGYGMTECGGAMTLTLPEDPLGYTTDTVGRPKMGGAAGVPGSDSLVIYKTVDPDTGADAAPHAEGELVSAGPTTMLRYWNRTADTDEVLRGGWLHSGDIGRVRPDGYLQVTGRSKELYKSGGELVMPKEIEDLLESFDDISQVFAIGLIDRRWGEIGCAVVVPAPGAALTEDDVFDRCRRNLARFKVPKRVVFYDADDLPTTPTGKVQKFRLVDEVIRLSTSR